MGSHKQPVERLGSDGGRLMAVNVNFGILRDRNFLADAAAGYDQGRKQAQQRGLADAGARAATDPLGASADLMRYGDLQGGNALRDRAYGQQAASALAAGDQPGALAAAGHLGPDQVATITQHFLKLDESHRKVATEYAEAKAAIGQGLRGVNPNTGQPYTVEERRAIVAHMAPALQQRFGVTPEELANLDLSDAGVDAIVQSGMTLSESFKRAETLAAQAETHRHNVATENKPSPAPYGYQWSEDHTLEFIPGGPADPSVVGKTAAARRAPSRGRGGGHVGVGASGLPPGYVLDH